MRLVGQKMGKFPTIVALVVPGAASNVRPSGRRTVAVVPSGTVKRKRQTPSVPYSHALSIVPKSVLYVAFNRPSRAS